MAAAAPLEAAQQRYWTGDGDGTHWSDGLNWIPRSAPQSGDDLVLEKPGEFTSTSMVNDLVGLTIHLMSFSGLSVFTTDWSLDGNDLILTGDISSTFVYDQDITFNCGLILGQSMAIHADGFDVTSTFRLNGGLDLNGHDLEFVGDVHGILRVSSGITGQGNIRVVNGDPSNIALAVFGGLDPNTFTGTLSAEALPGAQTCQLSFDKTGGSVVNDQLAIGPGGEVTLQRSEQVGDNAVVSISGGGRLQLNGHSETLGTLLLTNDLADVASTSVDASGATLTLQGDLVSWVNNPSVLPTILGTLNLSDGIHSFDVLSPTEYSGLSLQAQIVGAGGFVKVGNAALSLTASNNFDGSVAISEGIVDAYDAHALGSTVGGLTLFNGSLTLRNVIIANKTLFVRGTHLVTPNSAGSLVSCIGVGGWLGRIELNTNLVVYSTDLCVSGGPIVGPGGLEFLGSRNQLLDASILPNPYTYTGTTFALCELLLVGANNPFHGPVVVGGTGILTGPSVEMRWVNSVNNGLPELTLYTNGFANLNGRNDTWSRVTFNGGHLSTGTGSVSIADIIVNPTNVTALIDGNLHLGSIPTTRFQIGDGSANPDLAVNAVVSDGLNVIGVEKAGDGEMDFFQANTYRGATLVGAGTLGLLNNNSLGATSQGTTVASGATVAFGVQVDTVLESFTIAGAGVGGTNGALVTVGDVWINTNIVLSGPTAIRTQGTNSEIQVNNVSGTGPLTKLGSGRLVLRGNADNTYSGDTLVTEGVLDLAKPVGIASVPGHLIIGTTTTGATVPSARVEDRAGFTIVGSVTVNRGGLWDVNGQAEGFSIPALQGRPPLTLNDGGDVQTGTGIIYLPVGGDVVVNPGVISANSFISGNIGLDPGPHHFIVGSGISFFGSLELDVSATISQTSTAADLIKDGSGRMRLGGNNSFTGAVTVNAGSLILSNNLALGSGAAGTTVYSNAMLVLDGNGLTIANEALTLNSSNAAALLCNTGSNTWSGPITLSRDIVIAVFPSNGYLQVLNTVSGPGALTKVGDGTLQFWGLSSNSYSGLTTVAQGTLEAGRVNLTSIPGNVIIGDNSTGSTTATLRCLRDQQLIRTADVTANLSGLLDLFPYPTAPVPKPILRRVLGSGKLNLGAGTSLTLSNDLSVTFDGAVSGSGAFNKLGVATLRFTGDGSAYTGATTVFDGTWQMDGNFPSSPITVKANSMLRGYGAVGDVTVENGGLVKVDSSVPGQLGGLLRMNSANFQSGGGLSLAFYGANPTGGNDSVLVNNNVTLNSSTLSSGFLYPPHEGDVLTLIRKSAVGAINGAFSGFPEGAVRMIGNIPVVASYASGDGNDMTLTVTNLPLQGGGQQLISGNGGIALVPNDCSQLWLVVTNRGANPVTNLRGTLRSLTPGVVVTIGQSAYPNLAPNAGASNAIPFQIRTEPTFPCGSGVQFELVLTSSNLPSTAIIYTFLGGSGYGLTLDGIDARAQARTNLFPTLSNDFTVELWANPTGNRVETPEVNSGVSVLFHQVQRFAVFPDRSDLSYGPGHAGAGLSIGRNGISVFEQASNYFPSLLVYTNPVPAWTHVALVYSNRRPRLYVNGVLERTGLLSSAPFIHPCASLGGSIHGTAGVNFAGQLDEVRIWNTALNQSQIQSNMNRTLTGTESGLVVYYRCDEGSGSVLGDSAPASPSVTATLTNGAAFVFPGVVPFPAPGVDCGSGGGACESCLVAAGQFLPNTSVLLQSLSFNSEPSICYPAKPCPGTDPDTRGLPVPSVAHSYSNPTTNELCVTAQLHFGCASPLPYALGAVAYLGTNSPSDPCVNYVGDTGFDGTQPFSFRVPPGSNFLILVSARMTNVLCDSYTVEVLGAPCPPPMLSIVRDSAPNKARLEWSSAYPDFHLQSVDSLDSQPYNFTNIPATPVLFNGKFAVTNRTTAPHQYFRLKN